jgi:hypothetical protein
MVRLSFVFTFYTEMYVDIGSKRPVLEISRKIEHFLEVFNSYMFQITIPI